MGAREHAVVAIGVVAVIHQFLMEHTFAGIVFGRLADRLVFAGIQRFQGLLRRHDGVVVFEYPLAFLDAQGLGHGRFAACTGHRLHLGFARLALLLHVFANLVAQVERLHEIVGGESVAFLVGAGIA